MNLIGKLRMSSVSLGDSETPVAVEAVEVLPNETMDLEQLVVIVVHSISLLRRLEVS